MLTLFGLTAMLLLAPKAFSLLAIIVRGESARFGGAGRLLAERSCSNSCTRCCWRRCACSSIRSSCSRR